MFKLNNVLTQHSSYEKVDVNSLRMEFDFLRLRRRDLLVGKVGKNESFAI